MNATPPDRRAIVTEALRKIDDLTARLEIAEKADTEPIAVVGMGCRLPGGIHTIDRYWQFLLDGGNGVVRVPEDRWDADAFFTEDHTLPGTICSREGGFLTSWQPDEFDADFFGISPREAGGMDPQQRLLLEVAWEALEHAGITAQDIRGTQTAVFAGMTASDYLGLAITGFAGPEDVDPYTVFGNASNFAAGRLAYFLGVHGPAVVIDTACSSSLVTVHLACQSLRRREADQALAGGVNLILTPENSIACSRWGMLAPDGRCKTFDADANGYVRSEGAGVVVLKRLSDALRDGDTVWAVIRGSAVNQDGPSSGQTVPSGPAQQAVLRQALAASRLDPADIDYIEAHGTGTELGDPIELDALAQVFGNRDSAAPLILGSVKTNLGHLESAAGVAGFIKTVLSIDNGHIPRHLHFSALTPHASTGASRFTIPTEAMDWPAVSRPRRAGVSSFGVSGTNAHVVIEQAPAREPVARQPEPTITTLKITGKTEQRVAATAAELADWLAGAGAAVPLADVAHSLTHHRSRYKTVAAVSARTHDQAIAGLRALAEGNTAPGVVGAHLKPTGSGTVFLYSGQGSHWAGMGRQLLTDEPAFAAAVDELEPVFVDQVGFSLRHILKSGEQITGDGQVQPVVMGLQLALTVLWRSYGVQPDAVIGHSMGEVTAAVVAGALSPADGFKVIANRSRLMSRLAGQGAVALLELDAEATEELIAEFAGLSVAGYVSPRQTVVAGPVAPVDAVIAAVSKQERFARRVNMEVASHTALMDPILPELRSALADVTPGTPAIPFFSTVTEGVETPTLDAEYWVNNVRRPARVSQAISAAAQNHSTFVEISPHPILTHAITESLGSAHHRSIGTLQRDGDETIVFHGNLNTIQAGRPPQTPRPPGPRHVLPATPWQHTRHWVTSGKRANTAGSKPRAGTVLGQHIAVATAPDAHLWQAQLTPEAKPYPGSHRVGGTELVPASVLLQTLSAAAAELGTSALVDVRFEQPLVVDQPRTVQVVADAESVVVSSRPVTDADRWTRHVSARIAHRNPCPQTPRAGADLDGETVSADSVASLLQDWGIEGQPYRWSIDSCRTSPERLRADVALPDASAVALLDAAVHVARLVDASNPQLMFPADVESIRFGAELTDKAGTVEVYRRGGGDGDLIVDVAVKAPDGTTCVDIRSLRYAAMGAGPSATAGDPRTMAQQIEWQPWDGGADAPQAGDLRTLAVVGAGSAAATLRDRLASSGYTPSAVTDARYVVYVAEPGPGEADVDCAVRLSAEVADLVRRLADRDDDCPPTLWLVTRGVRDGSSDDAVRQSGLWGIAGVIRAEQPDIWGGLVDIEAGPDIDADFEGCASALSTVLQTPAKSILALRDGTFLAPVPVPVAGEPVRAPLRCQPDAAYLITGGLGALGLLMAGWLADLGARRIVLAGRTALPPRRDWNSEHLDAATRDKVAAVRALEKRGVGVEAVAVDIGSRDAVHDLLAARDDNGAPPIRGVIHAAGVNEGQLLTEISESRLRRTVWPKVAGAQVLHEAFPPGSVDFFYLTAAAGAVFGVPGQGAYATGNAYLDGLARARHRQGCNTLSLDWVAWNGLGFAADAHVVLHELERMGSRPVDPPEAFIAWEHVARFDIAQAVMAPVPSSDGRQPDIARTAPVWSEMPVDAVLDQLQTGLRSILARELQMPEAEIELDKPFAEFGLNSVMAMSVRRDTEQLVGLELSATMLWNHPTIKALAAYLAKKLLPMEHSDDGIDTLSDSGGGVLDDLFDSVEAASAGMEGTI